MVGALMQSTNFPSTISGESEIYSKRYGNTKRAVKMMCSLQTPPMSARTFSGLRGINALDNMVNRSQDLHSKSKVATATSIRKAKPSRIAPKAMFERFTEKAIKVIMVAQEEARQLGNNFVGPEMILLGLTSEGTGIAATVLKSMGIHLKDARVEVEKVIGRGSGFVAVEIPFTPRAKRVIQLSLEEARQLSHDYIGSEHLLLGLLREDDWVVAHDLENLGVDRKNIRSRVHINDGGNGTVVVEIPLTPRGKLGLVETLKEGEKLEDFLLGLLREDDGVALRVLKNLGADPFNIRKEVMKMVGESAEVVGAGVGGRSYWNKMLTQEYNDTNFDKLADEGKLDPFVEWQPQIERDTQIPVGLTKTKPETIEGKKVITLELRELEGRLKKLIKLSDEIISFIDEFHTLIGARAGEGDIDAA